MSSWYCTFPYLLEAAPVMCGHHSRDSGLRLYRVVADAKVARPVLADSMFSGQLDMEEGLRLGDLGEKTLRGQSRSVIPSLQGIRH